MPGLEPSWNPGTAGRGPDIDHAYWQVESAESELQCPSDVKHLHSQKQYKRDNKLHHMIKNA